MYTTTLSKLYQWYVNILDPIWTPWLSLLIFVIKHIYYSPPPPQVRSSYRNRYVKSYSLLKTRFETPWLLLQTFSLKYMYTGPNTVSSDVICTNNRQCHPWYFVSRDIEIAVDIPKETRNKNITDGPNALPQVRTYTHVVKYICLIPMSWNCVTYREIKTATYPKHNTGII